MIKKKLNVIEKLTGNTQVVECELDASELDRLERFYDQTEELSRLSIVKNGIPCNLNINYDKEKGMAFNVTLPPEENILALLHKLRRFILNDEYASYNRVTGILGRKVNNPNIRATIKRQRKIYEGQEFRSQVRITSDGIVINSEEVLFTWLNSFEYHNDRLRRQKSKNYTN